MMLTDVFAVIFRVLCADAVSNMLELFVVICPSNADNNKIYKTNNNSKQQQNFFQLKEINVKIHNLYCLNLIEIIK